MTFILLGSSLRWNDKKKCRDDEKEQENYYLRSIGGIVIPGKTAELQVFAVFSAGYGKGLLAYIKENNFGWGIRVSILDVNN